MNNRSQAESGTVHKGRPERSAPHQSRRLETLTEISRVVSSCLDVQTLYDTVYSQVSRVMDTTLFFIALRQSDRDPVQLTYLRDHGVLQRNHDVPTGATVTTLVIDLGEPLVFSTDGEYRKYAIAHDLPEVFVGETRSEALILVPLNTGSRTIGALSVQSLRPNAYADEDVQTLSIIAAQTAVAIENARLFEQSQEAVRQTQALLHVAQMVSASLHVQTVLDSILVGIRDVLPYDCAAVMLPDRSGTHLHVVAARGLDDEQDLTVESGVQTRIPLGSGVTGTVYRSGTSVWVPDTRRFAGHIRHGDREYLSEMAVPLTRGNAVVGVLDVERQAVGSFSHRELDLLTLFASQAAIAIENARLFSNQQDRVFELQAIQTIVQGLTPLHDIRSIARLINRELAGLIDFHSCRLFVLDAGTNELIPISFAERDFEDIRVKVGQGITGWIAQHGRPELISNLLDDPRSFHIPGSTVREESMIGVPLLYNDRVQGVITLTKLGANQFDENALRLLEIIAAQTAIGFDRAQLYDRLRAEAVTDELTQLYNRRYLFERFHEERARAVRNRHTLIVLMLDIDKFKRVNDSFGHDAGDVVLKDLAVVVRRVVRAEDVVARYGGEEFCILVPEIPLAEAAQVAERLRRLIERHRLPATAGVDRITVSIGMAVVNTGDRDVEVFSRADLAMYEVKHRGGNQVCVFDRNRFHLFGDEPGLNIV